MVTSFSNRTASFAAAHLPQGRTPTGPPPTAAATRTASSQLLCFQRSQQLHFSFSVFFQPFLKLSVLSFQIQHVLLVFAIVRRPTAAKVHGKQNEREERHRIQRKRPPRKRRKKISEHLSKTTTFQKVSRHSTFLATANNPPPPTKIHTHLASELTNFDDAPPPLLDSIFFNFTRRDEFSAFKCLNNLWSPPPFFESLGHQETPCWVAVAIASRPRKKKQQGSMSARPVV